MATKVHIKHHNIAGRRDSTYCKLSVDFATAKIVENTVVFIATDGPVTPEAICRCCLQMAPPMVRFYGRDYSVPVTPLKKENQHTTDI
jgi:hypothetical protein